MRGTVSLLILLFVLTVSYVTGQKIPSIQSITIHSKVLNEERVINIYSPSDSVKPGVKYPVFFVLDSESLFLPAVGAVNFMNYSSQLPQIPEAFIVGITNTNRDRDMPVPQQINKTKGAENFLKFISEELLPYLNQNYSVSGLNVLIGHSQGGLFATYAAIEKPDIFLFILALDAPLTVDSGIAKDYKNKIVTLCNNRYFSAEALYGWREQFPFKTACPGFAKVDIEKETHESMPYKGIYEGLQFLFSEHVPDRKDLSLAALQTYYSALSKKYNCTYNIPSKVILVSAAQHIAQSNKKEAIALLNFYKEQYGRGDRLNNLLANANAIKGGPDKRIEFYINHSAPTADQIKPYLGKWSGILHVPGGQDVNIKWEIKQLDGKYVMVSRVADSFNSSTDFLFVSPKNELVFGRKQSGGAGIYLSTGKLSADGSTLTGVENHIGMTVPEGFDPPKPNTFIFKKLKD